ncbi:MAG: hypothetical protein IJ695_05595 [Butyrivibrio sp.]|nr:hypothetical protein [Butyrivibrio sp.]
MKKIKNIFLLIPVLCMPLFMCLFALGNMDISHAAPDLKEADYCSFVIPSDFVPCDRRGLFINKNYPMESSSIGYSYYYNGEDVLLTNREKLNMQDTLETPADDSRDLSKSGYESTVSAAYNKSFGRDVAFSVTSFEDINIDGYQGYRIESSYMAEDDQMVYQTVYMLLSRYKTFTITMQRAADDDCQELFDECASSIHVH